MTRFAYDQFAKEYLEDLLSPLGEVKTSRKVASEIREIDVYLTDSSDAHRQNIEVLGLLGKLATKSAIFEPFSNAASIVEIRSCINKAFDIFAELERNAKSANKRLKEDDFPRLWILSPTVSKSILNGFKASLDEENWGAGIHFLGEHTRTAIVVIHQLPRTEETLWLRVLGKGRVQSQAVDELKSLAEDNPLAKQAIDLLLNLKTTLEVSQNIDQSDRELIMQLSSLYERKLAEVRQSGLEEGIQTERRATIVNLLTAKFGELDEQLTAIIQPILELPAQEYTNLLLDLSRLDREELLARFSS